MKETMLRVGDEVRYRGSFGSDKTISTARVEGITLGGKYGTDVDEIPLDALQDWDTLSLDNHHWIYADQLVK